MDSRTGRITELAPDEQARPGSFVLTNDERSALEKLDALERPATLRRMRDQAKKDRRAAKRIQPAAPTPRSVMPKSLRPKTYRLDRNR